LTKPGTARDIAGMNQETASLRKSQASVSAPDTLATPGHSFRRRWSLLFLSYLPFYFVGWLFRKPGTFEVVASCLAAAGFLALFWKIWRQNGRPHLWQVLAIFGIGVSLSPFYTGWSVYTIYSMSFAARLMPRRRAVQTMVALEVLLLLVGLWLDRNAWPNWFAGLIFGAITGFGALMQADVERKNQELSVAHEEVRALATMAERERISRDLHDLLGHTLTLVAVKAELAARLVSRDAEAAEREMQAVAAAAREALSEVRVAVVGMKGASLAFELDKARHALTAAGIVAEISTVTIDGYPGQEAVLAMALREGVTNVIRHSGATRCEISLRPSASNLVLSIIDNGKGGRLVEGSGLKGMRARLAAIGGALEIKSDGKGAQLVAAAPLEAVQ